MDASEQNKAKKTQETIDVHKCIVICRGCGSTAVGLRGPSEPEEVVCDSCGNAMAWDPGRFTLIEYDEKHQVETMIEVQKAVETAERDARERAKADGDRPATD